MKPDNSVPRLVPKRDLNPTTGAAEISYYWDQKVARKVQIRGKLADQLSGYTLIRKDLDNALNWIQLAEKLVMAHHKPVDGTYFFHATNREAFDLIKAYFVAALSFYGKCFTEAAGRHAQVSRDWLDANYRELHDYYMKYRHNFAAHSGDEQLELAKTYVLVHPDGKEFIPFLPTARMQPDVVLPNSGEPGLGELIQHVLEKVLAKYDRLSQKIIHDLVIPAGVEFWVAASEKNEVVCLGFPAKR
jgi:hypothetical protein